MAQKNFTYKLIVAIEMKGETMKSDPVDAAIEAMERKPDVVESLGECIAMLEGVKTFIADLGPKSEKALARAKLAYEKAKSV